MVFWRKKQDGFEWHSYVRTNVLARRKQRRQKLEDAGAAAVFGVRQARWKVLAYLKSAAHAIGHGSAIAARGLVNGSAALWSAIRIHVWPRVVAGAKATGRGARRAAQASGRSIRSMCVSIAHGVAIGWALVLYGVRQHVRPHLVRLAQWFGARSRHVLMRIGEPELAGPLGLAALITTIAAGAHLYVSGLTQQTLFIGGLALALAVVLLFALRSRSEGLPFAIRLPALNLRKVPLPRRAVTFAVAVPMIVAAAGVSAWHLGYVNAGLPQMPQVAMPDLELPDINIAAFNPFKGEQLTGRARVLDGGHLKIGGQIVRIDAIDALLPGQTCKTRRGRTWACGQRAKSKLRRLVRRRTVTCEVSGADAQGIRLGTCTRAGRDLAAELVKQGYAFAHGGLFSKYEDEQELAKKDKSGIWQGEAVRPETYRQVRWQKAAKKAPGGCPIKGRVVRRKSVYALPWDRGYDRVRVRERRGGKWFCSEASAREAGFKHANRI